MSARVLGVTGRSVGSGTLMAQTKFSNSHSMQPGYRQRTVRCESSQGHHLLCGQTDTMWYNTESKQALHLQEDGFPHRWLV